MPVSVAPAVDRLLDVTDDEQGVSFARQHVLQQAIDDRPLQLTRVLELIHQHVVITDAGFLEDEVRIAVPQCVAEDTRRTTEQGAVVLLKVPQDDLLQGTHQLHLMAQRDGQMDGEIECTATTGQFGQLNRHFGDVRRHVFPSAVLRLLPLSVRQSAEEIVFGCLLRVIEAVLRVPNQGQQIFRRLLAVGLVYGFVLQLLEQFEYLRQVGVLFPLQ